VNFLVLCATVAAVLGALATAGPAANADTPGSAVRGPGFGQIAGGMLGSAGFTDSFGTAVDDAPGYGLNDSLAARQSGAAGSSLVFGTSPGASGYVAGPDVALGVPVRSNGGIQVFQGGTAT
jgi:hypothetical protein